MFFTASKALFFLTSPSNLAAMAALAGCLLLATRLRRAGVRLMAGGIIALLVFGYSPLGDFSMLLLSERFPPWKDDGRTPQGIIVLGGAISPEVSSARSSVELNAAAERMTAGVELARRFPKAKLVFSGGSANLIEKGRPEAEGARDLWTALGVPADQIVLEERSRTTAENATMTRDLVQPKPDDVWLLVTSAHHMPRSVGVFRAAGFDVVPYPVDWRTRGWRDAFVPFDTLSGGLARIDTAAHEWFGLITYRLSGRTDEWLPGPRGPIRAAGRADKRP